MSSSLIGISAATRRRSCWIAGALLLRCTAARIPLVECSEAGDCGEGSACSPEYRCVQNELPQLVGASPPEGSTEAAGPPSASEPPSMSEPPLVSMPPSPVVVDAESSATPAAPAAPAPEVTPLVVDDFEDGDIVPRDARFQTWESYSWSPGGQDVYYRVGSPAFNSNYSLHLRWSLLDVADGTTMYTGGGLRSLATNGVVDLSRYTRVVFSHRFEASGGDAGACKTVSDFTVSFGCQELGLAYQVVVPLSDSWTTVTLPLADFAIPDYLTDRGLPMSDCLALVDGISFGVGGWLVDGECSNGILSLDYIYFR
jgi:hypothetical protein